MSSRIAWGHESRGSCRGPGGRGPGGGATTATSRALGTSSPGVKGRLLGGVLNEFMRREWLVNSGPDLGRPSRRCYNTQACTTAFRPNVNTTFLLSSVAYVSACSRRISLTSSAALSADWSRGINVTSQVTNVSQHTCVSGVPKRQPQYYTRTVFLTPSNN